MDPIPTLLGGSMKFTSVSAFALVGWSPMQKAMCAHRCLHTVGPITILLGVNMKLTSASASALVGWSAMQTAMCAHRCLHTVDPITCLLGGNMNFTSASASALALWSPTQTAMHVDHLDVCWLADGKNCWLLECCNSDHLNLSHLCVAGRHLLRYFLKSVNLPG